MESPNRATATAASSAHDTFPACLVSVPAHRYRSVGNNGGQTTIGWPHLMSSCSHHILILLTPRPKKREITAARRGETEQRYAAVLVCDPRILVILGPMDTSLDADTPPPPSIGIQPLFLDESRGAAVSQAMLAQSPHRADHNLLCWLS